MSFETGYMRNFHQPGRSALHAMNGMIATSQPMASAAGIDVLRRGGNAIDAAIAASAVLCVTEPMMTGIGGDCFALLSLKGDSEIVGLNASGRAPKTATAEWYRERGYHSLPRHSVHSITVPGAVDGWARLMEDHGSLGLDDVLRYAIDYAENGYVVGPRVAKDWIALTDKLSRDDNATRFYLKNGKPYGVGDVHRVPEMGRVLRLIAKNGRSGFYEGEVAEDMVAYLKEIGGHHTIEDFAATASDYVTPIGSSYKGYGLNEIPPNGQGLTALIMLNLIGRFDRLGDGPMSPERLHLQIEAMKLAYDARNTFIADPGHAHVPVEALLGDAFTDDLAARISLDKAIPPAEVPGAAKLALTDTIYLSVVDKDKNIVSFINSVYEGFGSGFVSPKTCVAFQNRGDCFTLEDGHPNQIAGGKRPMHTIIPAMVTGEVLGQTRPVLSYGVMGGDYQPVGHAHVLGNLVDYHMDIQQSIDCPRLFYEDGVVVVEEGIPNATIKRLQEMGHVTTTAAMPHGGGQGIVIDWENGTLSAGSDPRKDGCALGY